MQSEYPVRSSERVSTEARRPEAYLGGLGDECVGATLRLQYFDTQVGVMEDDFTCLGLLCAIFFFPVGILCCLLLKTRRCSNCGAYFG